MQQDNDFPSAVIISGGVIGVTAFIMWFFQDIINSNNWAHAVLLVVFGCITVWMMNLTRQAIRNRRFGLGYGWGHLYKPVIMLYSFFVFLNQLWALFLHYPLLWFIPIIASFGFLGYLLVIGVNAIKDYFHNRRRDGDTQNN